MGQVLRNGSLWLVSLAFGLFNLAYIGSITFLPTYLNTARDVSLPVASEWIGVGAVVSMISAPLAGIVSDRLRSRKIPYVVGLVLTAVAAPLLVVFTGGGLIAVVALQGFAAGFVAPNIFAAAVEVVADEHLGGLAMGVVMVGQNAGQLLGPALIGLIVESGAGWAWAFGSLALVYLLAALAGAAAKTKPL